MIRMAQAGSRTRDLPATPQLMQRTRLLDIVSSDLRIPFDPREVLARVVDGSRFDEYKSEYGTSLVTGWASIHGFRVGVLANAQGVLFMEESRKATELILLGKPVAIFRSCSFRIALGTWSDEL